MSNPADRFYTGRYRALNHVGSLVIIFAGSYFALVGGKHWAWAPFVAALLVVCVCIVAMALVLGVVVARDHPTDEQLQRLKARLRLRSEAHISQQLAMGIGFGLVAGSIPSYWPDVLLGLLMLLSVAFAFFLWIWMRRRRPRHEAQPPATDE